MAKFDFLDPEKKYLVSHNNLKTAMADMAETIKPEFGKKVNKVNAEIEESLLVNKIVEEGVTLNLRHSKSDVYTPLNEPIGEVELILPDEDCIYLIPKGSPVPKSSHTESNQNADGVGLMNGFNTSTGTGHITQQDIIFDKNNKTVGLSANTSGFASYGYTSYRVPKYNLYNVTIIKKLASIDNEGNGEFAGDVVSTRQNGGKVSLNSLKEDREIEWEDYQQLSPEEQRAYNYIIKNYPDPETGKTEEVYISETEPEPGKYKIWIQLNGKPTPGPSPSVPDNVALLSDSTEFQTTSIGKWIKDKVGNIIAPFTLITNIFTKDGLSIFDVFELVGEFIDEADYDALPEEEKMSNKNFFVIKEGTDKIASSGQISHKNSDVGATLDSINENLSGIKGKGTNQFKVQWGAYLFGYTRAIIDLPHEVGKVTVVNAYAWQNDAHTALSASIDTDGDTPHQIVLRTQQNVQGCYGDVTLRIE